MFWVVNMTSDTFPQNRLDWSMKMIRDKLIYGYPATSNAITSKFVKIENRV